MKSLMAILFQSIRKKTVIIIMETKIMPSLKKTAVFFVRSPCSPYFFK